MARRPPVSRSNDGHRGRNNTIILSTDDGHDRGLSFARKTYVIGFRPRCLSSDRSPSRDIRPSPVCRLGSLERIFRKLSRTVVAGTWSSSSSSSCRIERTELIIIIIKRIKNKTFGVRNAIIVAVITATRRVDKNLICAHAHTTGRQRNNIVHFYLPKLRARSVSILKCESLGTTR